MSLLILPMGSAPGHTVALSEEALLRKELLEYFRSLRENWLDMDKLSAQVIEGVIHLETKGVNWTGSALSGRHTIDNDCLALIVMEETKTEVSNDSFGLPKVPSEEYSLVLRHLWIHAAIFMRETKYKERITALLDRLPPSPLLV